MKCKQFAKQPHPTLFASPSSAMVCGGHIYFLCIYFISKVSGLSSSLKLSLTKASIATWAYPTCWLSLFVPSKVYCAYWEYSVKFSTLHLKPTWPPSGRENCCSFTAIFDVEESKVFSWWSSYDRKENSSRKHNSDPQCSLSAFSLFSWQTSFNLFASLLNPLEWLFLMTFSNFIVIS